MFIFIDSLNTAQLAGGVVLAEYADYIFVKG